MDLLGELLKIIVGLLFIAALVSYWWDGLPPRGRGRWRRFLSNSEARDPPGTYRRGTSKTGSTLNRRNGNGNK